MTLNVIIKHPGLDIVQLGIKIEEIYGKSITVQYMFLDDISEDSHIRSILKTLYCIRQKDERYYYDASLQVYDESDTHQRFIRAYLEDMETKKIEKEIKDHGENIRS